MIMEVWMVLVGFVLFSSGAAAIVYWRGKKRIERAARETPDTPSVPSDELRAMNRDVDQTTVAAERMQRRLKALEGLAEERAKGKHG